MADGQEPRPKRRGNYYIPERLKAIEPELAAKYAAGESAASLAREYGISKAGVQGAARRQGVVVRGKAEAGLLYRKPECSVSPEERDDERPVAHRVAEKLGYDSPAGLSYDREFQTACARERRRLRPHVYRPIDRRRKLALDRIPAWQSRAEIVAFYDMAHDLGLEVDHIIPLQGEYVSGLNVISNLRLISPARNQSKQNKCNWRSDPLIGHPQIHSARVLTRVLERD